MQTETKSQSLFNLLSQLLSQKKRTGFRREPTRTEAGHEEVEQRIERVRKISRAMDSAWKIPGTNHHVGLDGLIGLIPGVGDVATSLISAFIVREAWQLGISKWKLARMIGNVAIDTLVGVVPVLGDFFDVAFKANTKNVAILEKHFQTSSPHNAPTIIDVELKS